MANRFSQWRIRLVSIFSAIIVCVLVYRIIQVQILRHEAYNEIAKRQWHRKIKWSARRGCIYDRSGHPVAVSHRTYTIGITPRDFPDNEEAIGYLASVTGKKNAVIRKLLRKESAYVFVARDISLSGEEEARLSSLTGVKLDANPERLNPLSSMVAGFVGSIDRNGKGNAGVELSFQDELTGADGWMLVNMDARDQAFRPVNAPGKKPVDGCDLVLTTDAGIQSIVDFELEQAIKNYGAVGGAALVIDPWTGDIIALSEKSSSPREKDSNWGAKGTLYSTSCIYEPGSTFKLVTDAFLLEKGKVDPYDVFYGENGEAEFDFAKFRDDHPYEWLTFKESFVYSSNICTIKAVKDSDRRDFFSFILDMGFGGRTGVDLPAESKGRLQDPSTWSGRSLASIAIGQEIGVTVMQMAMAYCALANGGTLITPRVALEARGHDGTEVRDFPVIKVRKILSPETCETMVDFCRAVVKSGTGTKAAIEGLDVAGKTGTAQKSDGHGYLIGRYIASFAGFAPASDPRLVCLVLLDEPDYRYHYGGSSAAVVFRKIFEGINMSTDIFAGMENAKLAVRGNDDDRVPVPSFLRMNAAEAEALASGEGLRLKYSTPDGEIFSQIPGPGSYIEKDGEVTVAFRSADPGRKGKVPVPDLKGLSTRKARRMLLELGLQMKIDGYGNVSNQNPRAGVMVSHGSLVKIKCRPGSGSRKISYSSRPGRRGSSDLAGRSGR